MPSLLKVEQWPWEFQTFPGLEDVLPAVKAFCAAALENQEPRWLTLLGPSGIGKTFILRQALRFLRRNWALDIKTTWPDGSTTGKLREFAHVIPERDLTDYRAPKEFAEFDVVFVEDIGSGSGLSERGSGAVLRGRIASLLQLRSRKWTLLDANMSRGEIAERLDPRIASRLNRDGSTYLELSADIPDFADR